MCGPAAASGSIMTRCGFAIRSGCAAELPCTDFRHFPEPAGRLRNSNVANCCGCVSGGAVSDLASIVLDVLDEFLQRFHGRLRAHHETYGVRCVSETGAKSLMVSKASPSTGSDWSPCWPRLQQGVASARLATMAARWCSTRPDVVHDHLLAERIESLSPSKRATDVTRSAGRDGTTKRMFLSGMPIGYVRRAVQQRLQMTRRRSAFDAWIRPRFCGSGGSP